MAEEKKQPKIKNKALRGVVAYLSDWRNWLVHGLVGIALLLIAIFAPIEWWIKIIILIIVIVFNCIRMSLQKKKKCKTN